MDTVQITDVLRAITASGQRVTISQPAEPTGVRVRWRVDIGNTICWDENLGFALVRCAALCSEVPW